MVTPTNPTLPPRPSITAVLSFLPKACIFLPTVNIAGAGSVVPVVNVEIATLPFLGNVIIGLSNNLGTSTLFSSGVGSSGVIISGL